MTLMLNKAIGIEATMLPRIAAAEAAVAVRGNDAAAAAASAGVAVAHEIAIDNHRSCR
jgi:hypothetical protein